jgi:hypothetical protein
MPPQKLHGRSFRGIQKPLVKMFAGKTSLIAGEEHELVVVLNKH